MDILKHDVLRTGQYGTSHVKIYFHDILFDEFDIYVGADIVQGIKLIRNGDADTSIFNGYSELQQLNVQAIINMLDKTVNDSMSDYEKVVAIKNWYASNVEYNLTGSGADSLSEIFLNHQGQCEDYTIVELNEKDGFGVYYKGVLNYRTSEKYMKLRASDYSNDTEPYGYDSGIKDFSEFNYE